MSEACWPAAGVRGTPAALSSADRAAAAAAAAAAPYVWLAADTAAVAAAFAAMPQAAKLLAA